MSLNGAKAYTINNRAWAVIPQKIYITLQNKNQTLNFKAYAS